MSWVDAIKKYAEQNDGHFVIPKRGSDEYEAVKKIQEALANPPAASAKKVRAKPVKTANVVEKKIEEVKEVPHKKVAPPPGEKVANVVVKEEKKARATKAKVEADASAVLPDAVPKRGKAKVAAVVEAPVVEEKPKRKYTKKVDKMKIVNEPVTMVFN